LRHAVTCRAGDHDGDRIGSLIEIIEGADWRGDRPLAVVAYRCGQRLSAQGHTDGIAHCPCPADFQRLRDFGAVNNAVTRKRIQGISRCRSVNLNQRRIDRFVAHRVGNRNGDVIASVIQQGQIPCRDGGGPVAVGVNHSVIGFTVQRDHHGIPRRRGAVDIQRLSLFGGVNDAVRSDGFQRQLRQNRGDIHRGWRCRCAIARRVRRRHDDGLRARRQRLKIGGG